MGKSPFLQLISDTMYEEFKGVAVSLISSFPVNLFFSSVKNRHPLGQQCP